MLDFSDQPYRFTPARYQSAVAWLLRLANGYYRLPQTLKVRRVHVSGQEHLANTQANAGDQILMVCNHPTHFDAAIILEAQRQMGIASWFMAAYDVFLRRKLDAWVMQKLGCFSVDREGSDSQSVKEAIRVLAETPYALTIFPEGNVYLENDRVTPFNDGAAFIAVRAAKALQESNRRLWILPTSIKASYVEDVRPKCLKLINEMEAYIQLDTTQTVRNSPRDRLIGIGTEAVQRNLTMRGIPFDPKEDLREMIEHASEATITQLEAKVQVTPGPKDTLTDRVRKLRQVIHEVRTDPERAADHQAAAQWADEAMIALKIISYQGNYVASHPTCDRLAEATEKLAEDLFNKMMPPFAQREAWVDVGEPINVTEVLQSAGKPRQATRQLTEQSEQTIQAMIDQRRTQLNTAGSQLW